MKQSSSKKDAVMTVYPSHVVKRRVNVSRSPARTAASCDARAQMKIVRGACLRSTFLLTLRCVTWRDALCAFYC